MLLFGPAGGLFADRHDKRRVLYVTQALAGLLAGGSSAICLAAGAMHLWVVYVLAARPSASSTSSTTRRGSPSSPRWVPEADLPNAVLLNSVVDETARVFFGAAVGGTVAAVPRPHLVLCAQRGCPSSRWLLSLALMSAAALYPAKKVAKKKGQIVAGLPLTCERGARSSSR